MYALPRFTSLLVQRKGRSVERGLHVSVPPGCILPPPVHRATRAAGRDASVGLPSPKLPARERLLHNACRIHAVVRGFGPGYCQSRVCENKVGSREREGRHVPRDAWPRYQREGPLRGTDAPVTAVLLYRKHVITEQPYIAQLVTQMEAEGTGQMWSGMERSFKALLRRCYPDPDLHQRRRGTHCCPGSVDHSA